MDNRIFATYDNEGNYTGFYHTEFFKVEDIPSPSIELTEDEWNQTFDVRCLVVNGKHTIVPLSYEEESSLKMASLRSERDRLLRESDWTQMVSDIPLSESQKEAWRVYRQALRDLPETADLNNVEFPVAPK